MAPPTRSNTLTGLPSSPSPRSRSLPRVSEKDLIPRSNSTTGLRSRAMEEAPPLPPLRHRSSLASVHSDNLRIHQVRRLNRIPPPPLPVPFTPVPSRPLLELAALSQNSGNRLGSSSSISSMASTSSSVSSSSGASSVFSNRTPLSSSSSVTSTEEDKIVVAPSKSPTYERDNSLTTPDGFSSSIWHKLNKVTEVAGQLSVSFGKAMEATISAHHGTAEKSTSDEGTGLAMVLEDYHVSKPQEPSDLTDWLFEERDRGFNGSLAIANPSPEEEGPSPSPPSLAPFTKDLPLTPNSPPASTYRSLLLANIRKDSISGGILNVGKPQDDENRQSIRVRFVEQDHPRRSGNKRGDGLQQFSPPPAVELDLPRGRSRGADYRSTGERVIGRPSLPPKKVAPLPGVDVRGRRVAAGGLPSGVRPQRPQRPQRPM